MPTPIILAFNIKPDKLGRLRLLALRIKAMLKAVDASEYNMTLENIINAPAVTAAAQAAEGEAFTSEMLVMANLTGAQMHLFLDDFKHFGIPPIPLKAMLTNTNKAWTPLQLCRELSAEREALSRGMTAHPQK